MVSDENLFKRLEDQKWKESVSTRLVSLTDSEINQNDRLDAIQEHLEQLNSLLEGDPADKKDNGLKGDIIDLNRELNQLRAVLMPDALGNGGFKNRMTAVEQRLGLGEKRSDNLWAFGTKVAVATIGAIATILVALLAIEPARNAIGEYLERHFSIQSSRRNSKTDLKRSGSRPKRRQRPLPIAAPPEEDDHDGPAQGVPEVR